LNRERGNDVEGIVSAAQISSRQQFFLRYFTAVLVDLVVLNLFVEFWDRVHVDAFSISLLVAVLLQLLLQLTLRLERQVAAYFNARTGAVARFLRYFSAWLILFLSKFVILYALTLVFGDAVRFSGAAHGVVAFIVVIVAMLATEEVILRVYRRLA
jgi:hypothetical protein